MRELKFRAWGRYGQWDDDGEKRKWEMVDGDDLAFIEFEPLCDLLKDKEDEEYFMQYTGLKDKNGKEIYEGDILRFPGDPVHFACYEVFFHDGDANSDFNIGYSCSRAHYHGSICGGPIPSFKPKSVCQMEIIGNIHEHSHLLQQ